MKLYASPDIPLPTSRYRRNSPIYSAPNLAASTNQHPPCCVHNMTWYNSIDFSNKPCVSVRSRVYLCGVHMTNKALPAQRTGLIAIKQFKITWSPKIQSKNPNQIPNPQNPNRFSNIVSCHWHIHDILLILSRFSKMGRNKLQCYSCRRFSNSPTKFHEMFNKRLRVSRTTCIGCYMCHLLETLIIQEVTDALLGLVRNIYHALVCGISTRDYHRPTGYKLTTDELRVA